MPKRLRDYPLYIAPGISGNIRQDGTVTVFDEVKSVNLDPYNTENKIYIYERQVKGWFLEMAKSIADRENAIFIVLMVCLSYIEGVEQYRKGRTSNGNSKIWFRDGIRRIFNLINVSNMEIDKLYKQGRCGLFHVGMSDGDIVVSTQFDEAINFTDPTTITINTDVFLNSILNDFEGYVKELKKQENEELRNNFNQMYNLVQID